MLELGNAILKCGEHGVRYSIERSGFLAEHWKHCEQAQLDGARRGALRSGTSR